MPRRAPVVALTIAGSDPSGGAGVQADLKTFAALGAYGTSVLTALTAQNTRGVTGIQSVPPEFVARQLDTLIADVRIDVVKVGMVGSAEVADLVAGYLRAGGPLAGRPVVVDPVMAATCGAPLLTGGALDATRRLVGVADVVTPNLAEAGALLGAVTATDVAGMRAQGAAILDLGVGAALVKGGHLADGDAVDVWVDRRRIAEIRGPRIPTSNTHGTGCSLSSALAALRPVLGDWVDAARAAKQWLTGALERADELDIGSGPGPVHHLHRWFPTSS